MAASTAVATRQERRPADLMEKVLLDGDLGQLTPEERMSYYQRVCESLGLNPLTRPFQYHTFQGKMILYARKDCTEQLRKIHDVSIGKPEITPLDDLVVVTVEAHLPNGRTDSDAGAVTLKGLAGEARANAILKAITKAKRRVTLSICGLGTLDETEVEDTPSASSQQGRQPVISEPAEAATYRTLDALLSNDAEAAADLKTWLESKSLRLADLSLADVKKTIARLEQRAADRALEPESQPLADEETEANERAHFQTLLANDPEAWAQFNAALEKKGTTIERQSREWLGQHILKLERRAKEREAATAAIEHAATVRAAELDETPF